MIYSPSGYAQRLCKASKSVLMLKLILSTLSKQSNLLSTLESLVKKDPQLTFLEKQLVEKYGNGSYYFYSDMIDIEFFEVLNP